jgi:hypothetical protein
VRGSFDKELEAEIRWIGFSWIRVDPVQCSSAKYIELSASITNCGKSP